MHHYKQAEWERSETGTRLAYGKLSPATECWHGNFCASCRGQRVIRKKKRRRKEKTMRGTCIAHRLKAALRIPQLRWIRLISATDRRNNKFAWLTFLWPGAANWAVRVCFQPLELRTLSDEARDSGSPERTLLFADPRHSGTDFCSFKAEKALYYCVLFWF